MKTRFLSKLFLSVALFSDSQSLNIQNFGQPTLYTYWTEPSLTFDLLCRFSLDEHNKWNVMRGSFEQMLHYTRNNE